MHQHIVASPRSHRSTSSHSVGAGGCATTAYEGAVTGGPGRKG